MLHIYIYIYINIRVRLHGHVCVYAYFHEIVLCVIEMLDLAHMLNSKGTNLK